ncbi:Rhs family protein [Chitinispirillum alkaliphilum]|nr:Rhs family protein [Chitinispirillum alkaliphilum]
MTLGKKTFPGVPRFEFVPSVQGEQIYPVRFWFGEMLPNGQISYLFNDTTNNLTAIQSLDADISYSYDGSMITETQWSGAVNGSVGIAFNNNFQIASRTVNGAHAIEYTYDKDGQPVTVGDMSFSLDEHNGRLNGSVLHAVSDNYSYNNFGDLTSYTATLGGSELYSVQHTETDALGRLVNRTETVEGETVLYNYNYDLNGQLTTVYRNGSLYSSYGYDSNGNRISYVGPRGNVTGSYDNQDRMLSYGDNTYQYTDNGELLSKTNSEGTTHYNYDVLGNLLSVTLPDGTNIEYIIDGRNRRIGRRVNGSLISKYLYQDQLNPVAELDPFGNVVSRFVYGTRMNVPDYMIRDGVTYRIISDHLGSVRLVVNAQSGEVVQRIDYDEFGVVLFDSNPGFQPFGFAGGLYDELTGLVRFGARDYDAESGRWTSKDPIGFDGGHPNIYSYCGNSPVEFIDPTGKIAATATIAATSPIWGPPVLKGILYIGSVLAVDELLIKPFFRDRSNPFRGPPGGVCEIPGKQTRKYGPDGFPDIDIDFDHDHGQGTPHEHKWRRPSDGSPPTHKDRGHGTPVKE